MEKLFLKKIFKKVYSQIPLRYNSGMEQVKNLVKEI